MIESLKCTQVVVAGGKKTSANTHYRCQHLSYRFNLRPATRHHPRNKTQTGRDEAEPVLDTEFRAVRQPSTFYPLIHPQLAHLLSTRPSTLYSLIHPLLAHPPSTQGREGGREGGKKVGREGGSAASGMLCAGMSAQDPSGGVRPAATLCPSSSRSRHT